MIPIPAVTATFLYKGHSCSRKQFPISLAWAITSHKSQGLTLKSAVIELGKKEMVNGISFVAISRVRRISDLAFVSSVPFSRLDIIRKGKNMMDRLAEDTRLDMMERGELNI
jgi:ATP-dependent DNA helicase PIF1